MMTDTEVEWRMLGTAWPRHFNKTVAETMQANIEMVGMPEWTEDNQALAKAVQELWEVRSSVSERKSESFPGHPRDRASAEAPMISVTCLGTCRP